MCLRWRSVCVVIETRLCPLITDVIYSRPILAHRVRSSIVVCANVMLQRWALCSVLCVHDEYVVAHKLDRVHVPGTVKPVSIQTLLDEPCVSGTRGVRIHKNCIRLYQNKYSSCSVFFEVLVSFRNNLSSFKNIFFSNKKMKRKPYSKQQYSRLHWHLLLVHVWVCIWSSVCQTTF